MFSKAPTTLYISPLLLGTKADRKELGDEVNMLEVLANQ